MAKKQNKPTKTCADCIHEFACRGWTGGRYISDDSASRCPNHETVKESGAYLCGVLDERKRKKTNADRIRSMSDEELALWICGVYDIEEENGKFINGIIIPGYAPHDIEEWLQQPAEETER